MKLPSSLGWRVALAYTTLIAGAIGFGSFYVSDAVRESYEGQVDQHAKSETRLVAQTLAPLMAGDPPAEAIQRVADASAEAIGARVTVFAPDGRVLADTSDGSVAVTTLRESPEVADALSDARVGSRREGGVTSAAVPVVLDGATVGAVRIVVSEPAADQVVRSILLGAASIGALMTALGGMLAIWLVRRTVRSVMSVSDGARRLAAGDLGHRVYAGGRDEAARLATAFNGMADRLQATVNDLSTERNTLNALLETMSDGVVLVAEGDTIVLANEAARQLFDPGFHGADAVTTNEVLRDHDVRELLNRCRESGAPQWADIDLPQVRRYVRTVAMPVSGTEGEYILITFHDQSEQRRLDDTRREFVSNVSHELRTPIASINAMAETLEEGALRDEVVAADFVGRIRREATDMADLVSDLLALSRIEAGEIARDPGLLDIRELVEDVAARFHDRAEAKEITITVTSAAVATAVHGEESLLRLVVSNLLDNAVRFTPQGGTIQVRTNSSGRTVRIEVEDSGPGIEPEHLLHVFERFYKADRSRAEVGTGLGLSIARHVIEGYGGEIGVESAIGSGATFALTLPTVDSS